MYTKAQFGKDLKKKLLMNLEPSKIGRWVYLVYWEYINKNIDPELENLLLTLNTMEDGPEFEFSYEELHKIADDLIAGKDVRI